MPSYGCKWIVTSLKHLTIGCFTPNLKMSGCHWHPPQGSSLQRSSKTSRTARTSQQLHFTAREICDHSYFLCTNPQKRKKVEQVCEWKYPNTMYRNKLSVLFLIDFTVYRQKLRPVIDHNANACYLIVPSGIQCTVYKNTSTKPVCSLSTLCCTSITLCLC